MRVFNVENEADIGKLLLTVAVADRMENQHFDGGKPRQARRGHAANHPARKCVRCENEAIFNLGHTWRTTFGKMRRRYNGTY